MRRWILTIFVILGLIVFVWVIKAPILSNYITKKMGVPVRLGTISVWPSHTKIGHFRILNPPEYQTRTALEIDYTKINYHWNHLITNPHEIEQIVLNDVFLYIYVEGIKNNNWVEIAASIPEKRSNEEVLINKLVINNLTVMTEGPGAKKFGIAGTQHFDKIEFNHIDSREGFPTKELISKIFQKMGMGQILDKFLNPERYLKKALKPWNLFGEAPAIQGAQED